MAIRHPAGAIGLRYHRVETQQQITAKHRAGEEQNAAKAHGADGDSAVRQAADHDGVDDAHGIPAQFGKHQRPGQRQQRPPFAPDVIETGHLASIARRGW